MATVRPPSRLDPMLIAERTTMAWERTAVAMMVSGVLLARFAAAEFHLSIAFVGLLQTAFGGGVLVWSTRSHDDRGRQLRHEQPVFGTSATRVVGLTTMMFIALSFGLAVATVTS